MPGTSKRLRMVPVFSRERLGLTFIVSSLDWRIFARSIYGSAKDVVTVLAFTLELDFDVRTGIVTHYPIY